MNIQIKPFDETYFQVSFLDAFNSSMLNAVRNVPGRVYKAEEKQWLLPLRKKSCDILLYNLYKTGLFNVPEKIPSDADRAVSDSVKKMKELLYVKHYSPRTIESYERWIKDFLKVYSYKEDYNEPQI